MLLQGLAFLLKGGWVMWFLIACAFISVAVMIERWLVIRRAVRAHERLVAKLPGLLAKGQVSTALSLCEQTGGPVARMLANGLRHANESGPRIESAMEETALLQIPLLQKRLGVLDTIITLSPLLGLLGTITGMIRSFHVVAVASGAEAGGAITGGVAEALIATATGLTIAIVTLPIYNHLNEQVKELISEMEGRATQLLNLLQKEPSRETAASGT